MKQSILVTGIAGSGKSTLSSELRARGYGAYNFEEIEGMFQMHRQDTGELYEGYRNEDPDMVKNAEWRCDSAKLKALVEQQKEEIAFYCGAASNMDDIIPLFTKFLLLHVSPQLLRQRLLSREGTEEFGGTEEVRQQILGWKDWWEDEMRDRGAIQIDASGDVATVADRIIALVKVTT